MRLPIAIATLFLVLTPVAAQQPPADLAATADGATETGPTADGATVAVTAEDAAAAAANAAAEANGLGAIPYPDLDALESDVGEQLREIEGIVQSLLTGPRPEQETLREAYAELGRHYHAYGLEEAAEASYRNALRLRPKDFEILYLMGVLHQQAGRLGEADAVFQAALELRPNDLATLVREGEVMLALNQPELAEKLFAYALQIDPDCAAAHAGLGEAALSRQEHAAAVRELERALELVPAANRLHYSLAMAYRGLGDRDQAREHLAQHGTVGVKPPDPLVAELETLKRGERVYLLRGRTAFAAGRYQDAAKAFAAAVAARPDSARARVNLGTTLGLLGDAGAAIAQYREALELEPDNRTASFNLGALLAQAGATDEAILHLEAALAGDEEDPQAHLELARALQRAGRLDDARGHFARVVELDPLSEDGRLGEAGVLVAQGRYAEALDQLERAHAVLPTQGRTSNALARLLAASPELELRDGERALTLALRVFGALRSARHATTVAMALAELGRCSEAVEWQTQALDAAEQAGDRDLAANLRATLDHYRQNDPCRYPG